MALFLIFLISAWLPAQVTFTDVTQAAGIRWKHENAASPRKYLIETMGSGGAWLDYDQDGHLDLFLVNGGATPSFQPARIPRHALYRNNGDGTFSDVTAHSGLGSGGSYGMGAAAADFDNDGYPDLYVSGYPRSFLFRNKGDRSFADVTERAGVTNQGRFASSAGWFDYNRDGHLDLLVLNYVDWSYETDVYCGDRARGIRQYCHPDNYRGMPPVLYRNNGDGTFSDVTRRAGLDNPEGKGLGLVLADFNLDGWTDIFIANDGVANFLYWNRRNGTFEDASLSSGVAYSEDGMAEAGMGTDAADFLREGYPGIYVTHLEFQWNRLYRNLGQGRFLDFTVPAGLARGRNLMSGFGTRFLDYDNDGWQDLVVVNGHILDNIQQLHPEVEYAEPKIMLRNLGAGKFTDVSAELGPAFRARRVGRGALVADFDNDGDPDLAATNNGQSAQLLRNDGGNRNHWIAMRLIGASRNRDAIGARITIRSGAMRQSEQIRGGCSYLSTGDLRVYFGLGSTAVVDEVEIVWPDGRQQRLGPVRSRQFITVRQPSLTP